MKDKHVPINTIDFVLKPVRQIEAARIDDRYEQIHGQLRAIIGSRHT